MLNFRELMLNYRDLMIPEWQNKQKLWQNRKNLHEGGMRVLQIWSIYIIFVPKEI